MGRLGIWCDTCRSVAGGFDDSKVLVPIAIVLRHMFTRGEVVEDPTVLQDLHADVSEECAKFGPIEKVKVGGG